MPFSNQEKMCAHTRFCEFLHSTIFTAHLLSSLRHKSVLVVRECSWQHYSQDGKVQTAQMSINERMDEQNVAHPYDGILFGHKKALNTDTGPYTSCERRPLTAAQKLQGCSAGNSCKRPTHGQNADEARPRGRRKVAGRNGVERHLGAKETLEVSRRGRWHNSVNCTP